MRLRAQMEETDDRGSYFRPVEARLLPLLPRRRRFRRHGRWLTPRQAFAEARGLVSLIKDSAATSPIVTHKLRNNISALEGSGGNIAVLTGPDGKVMIDAGIGVSRPQLTKALADLSPEPITHAHQYALAFRPYRRKRMAQLRRRKDHRAGQHPQVSVAKCSASRTGTIISSPWRRAEFRAKPSPTRLILSSTALSLELKRYAPAHTDSDISVNFAEANIVHVGDTFWNGVYPFIDYSTGGSIDGMIAACDANLAAATADTIIIAGHGQPVSNKSELKEFRDMLVGVRENVATLKRQGRTRDEIVAAKPTAAYDAKFGAFVIDPGFFTRLVYEGV